LIIAFRLRRSILIGFRRMEKLAQRDLATVAGIFDKLISDGRVRPAIPERSKMAAWVACRATILHRPGSHSLPIAPSEDAEACGELDAASGLVANTVLYGFPKTNTFEVRQMIRSNSTNVRILSRYFHNTRC
jgi:hypothetical protein